MIYEYYCESCKKSLDVDFPFGKAEKEVKCEECGKLAYRDFNNQSFKCHGPGANLKFKNEMTKKNEKAASKMRSTWEGSQPKLIEQ